MLATVSLSAGTFTDERIDLYLSSPHRRGYIQGRIRGDCVLLYLGVIDILQSYRLKKKLEHTFKGLITDGVSRVVDSAQQLHHHYIIILSLFDRTLSLCTTLATTPEGSKTLSETNSSEEKKVSECTKLV